MAEVNISLVNRATKWVKQTGWDPFKYEKKGKSIMTYYLLIIMKIKLGEHYRSAGSDLQ